ncbi:hypothetical protein SLE2022_117850 [Rubroshorea leprosula]
MASETVVGEGNDGTREKQRYMESKVYTRKAFKGPKNNTTINKNNNSSVNDDSNNNSANNVPVSMTAVPVNDENEKNNVNDSVKGPLQALPSEDANSAQQQLLSCMDIAASNDSSSLNRQQSVAENGTVKPSEENQLKINLASTPKQEIRQLRRKLESELDMVRRLVKRIEEKEGQISEVSNSHILPLDGVDNGQRIQLEVALVGTPHEPVRQSRPLNQLNISVLENTQGVVENVEKEKRTPKANQFYRNSEFLLAKDKFPSAESNKKSKVNGKKQGGGDLTHGFGMGSKIFKSCSALLERLMKHKHGWVFNAPVDVQGLGLHDYYSIIKQPMDLGTIKSRLNKNWYKSPREFAEDVRLTFRNAMTYNPKGQDVHIMAEELSKIFEDKWASIEADYNRQRFSTEYEIGLPLLTSRTAPSMLPPPLDMRRILDRSASMTYPVDLRLKSTSTTPSGRTPTPKKPKAKDLHKRDMTFEEKQKLSNSLQNLPSEKLDNIVQIIKKRNSSLLQHDDEIEVDIDSFDTDTLWELDRFVTNYKKSLSKNKRKAELAMQARAEAEQVVPEKALAPVVVVEVPKENRTDERNILTLTPVEVEKQGDNASRSSSSTSSTSDSGSSSSDSDSESSSASGSDAGRSPRS